MDFTIILDILIGGLLIGGIYALIAMGLSLQYGVARVLNVAHGEFIMLGGFGAWILYSSFNISPLISLVIIGPVILIIGFLLHGTMFRSLLKTSPSLDAFEDSVVKNGLIIVNSSIVDRKVKRNDVDAFYIPLTEIASKLGLTAAANMVCLGAYLEYTKLIDYKLLAAVIPLTLKRKNLVDINIKAVEEGAKYIREHYAK